MTQCLPTSASLPVLARAALSILAGVALVVPCSAATILFDFSTSLGAGGPGGTWNAFAAPGNVSISTALVDSAGLASSLRIGWTGQLNNSGNFGTSLTFNNNQAGFEGSPAWATSTSNNNATGDLFFTSNASDGATHAVTFTLSGLTAGDSFSLDFLGSRNVTNAEGFYEFSIDGGASYSGFTVLNADGTAATASGWGLSTTQTQFFDNQLDGFNNHRYMNGSGTLPGSTLLVRVTDNGTAGGNFAAINAMRLTTVPEPAGAALLALGGAAIGLRRRRM